MLAKLSCISTSLCSPRTDKRVTLLKKSMHKGVGGTGGLYRKAQTFCFDPNRKHNTGVTRWLSKPEQKLRPTYKSWLCYLLERVKARSTSQAQRFNNLPTLKCLTPGMWWPILLSIVCPQDYANSAWKFLSYSHLIYTIHYPCLHDWHLPYDVWLVALAAGSQETWYLYLMLLSLVSRFISSIAFT